jgi:fumarate reductase flavoprotein subunit
MSAADVVIVGAGTAGLAAAIEAARLGLRVTILEQSERTGGTLWRSWAQMSAGGTLLQEQRGIQDNPQLHYDDVMRISKNTADPRLVRLAVERAPDTIDWLMSCGFDMDPAAPAIVHFHEPYSLPRTYWGRNGGRSVLEVLLPPFDEACDRGTITMRLGTTMTALSLGRGSHLDGLRVQGPGSTVEEIETPVVILASGGYAGNPALFPNLTHGAPLVSPAAPTSTGSGILACAAIGARVNGGDLFLPTYGGILQSNSSWRSVELDAYPVLTPQDRQPWEIHVNLRGERFIAEDSPSVDLRENALIQQPGLEFWIVYDDEIRAAAPPLLPSWRADEIEAAFATHPSFVVADSLSKLAAAAGLDGDQLTRTVDDYNAGVRHGGDLLGRRHLPAPIAHPPFYSIRNHGSTLKSPAGIQVDQKLRVLSANGAIDNLFAIGEAIGGSRLSGRSFVSGMSVTPALSFGRLLAQQLSAGDFNQLDGA